MSVKTQIATAAGFDAARLQVLAYGSLERLGWDIKYAGDNILVATTANSGQWSGDEVSIEMQDNQLSVKSEMKHGGTVDLMGRNQSHIDEFLTTFEIVKSMASDLDIGEWSEKILALKSDTIKATQQILKRTEDADKVMNFSKGKLYITYTVIAINVLVFVLMIASGVDVFTPTTVDIIKWGGNYAPLTLSGDWWRLITSVFVHIGIIHIAFNMYALYMVGIYLEPLLGKKKYAIAYICTGVFASLTSLWWHKEPITSAGASGAIFGMYGVFVALLSTNLIPKEIRRGLLQSIGVFILYNLAYGMKSGVDNSAHVGGLISGLAIGYIYYIGLRGSQARGSRNPVIAIVAASTIIITFLYLNNNKENTAARKEMNKALDELGYKDGGKFNEIYNQIIEIQNKALVPLHDTLINEEKLAEELKTISLPEWEIATGLTRQLKRLNVSEAAKHKAEVMERYVDLRKDEISVILKLISAKEEGMSPELTELREKIDKTVMELDSL